MMLLFIGDNRNVPLVGIKDPKCELAQNSAYNLQEVLGSSQKADSLCITSFDRDLLSIVGELDEWVVPENAWLVYASGHPELKAMGVGGIRGIASEGKMYRWSVYIALSLAVGLAGVVQPRESAWKGTLGNFKELFTQAKDLLAETQATLGPSLSAKRRRIQEDDFAEEDPSIRYVGFIKNVNTKTGHGFIECMDLKDTFPNDDIGVLSADVQGFVSGDCVSFVVAMNDEGWPQAKNLQSAEDVDRSNCELWENWDDKSDIASRRSSTKQRRTAYGGDRGVGGDKLESEMEAARSASMQLLAVQLRIEQLQDVQIEGEELRSEQQQQLGVLQAELQVARQGSNVCESTASADAQVQRREAELRVELRAAQAALEEQSERNVSQAVSEQLIWAQSEQEIQAARTEAAESLEAHAELESLQDAAAKPLRAELLAARAEARQAQTELEASACSEQALHVELAAAQVRLESESGACEGSAEEQAMAQVALHEEMEALREEVEEERSFTLLHCDELREALEAAWRPMEQRLAAALEERNRMRKRLEQCGGIEFRDAKATQPGKDPD